MYLDCERETGILNWAFKCCQKKTRMRVYFLTTNKLYIIDNGKHIIAIFENPIECKKYISKIINNVSNYE